MPRMETAELTPALKQELRAAHERTRRGHIDTLLSAGLEVPAFLLNNRRPSDEWMRQRVRAFRERTRDRSHPLGVKEYLRDYHVPMAGGASYFNIVLDTTAPAGVTLTLAGGASYTSTQTITAAIATSDSVTTGYQMKLWGSVDTSYNADIQATEGASNWITYSTSQSIKLSSGDASKTINVRIRDDVLNPSSSTSASITLDTSVPTITIQAGSPDVTKISKTATKDTVTVVWQSDVALASYDVELVANGSAAHGTGTIIPTTAGSTNTSGGATSATTNVTTTIKGTDLETAAGGAGNDGTKVIKIFGRASGGSQNWSN